MLSHKQDFYINHYHQGSGNIVEREVEECEDLEDGEESCEMLSSRHDTDIAVIIPQQLGLPSQSLPKVKTAKIQA